MHCYNVSTPEEYSWFSSLTMCVCYSLFVYSCKKLIEDYVTINTTTNDLLNDITTNIRLDSIKETHNDGYKQKMFQELLDVNSLERCYILYFIFKRKGDFKTFTSIKYIDNELTTILTNTYINKIDTKTETETETQIETQDEKENTIFEDTDIETDVEDADDDTEDDAEDGAEAETEIETEPQEKSQVYNIDEPKLDTTPKLNTYNSYELYNKIMNKLDLDLDETSIPDIKIQIGENTYELTREKCNFIQWLYYIGLYDYLTDINNSDIKYDILNEMNELGLLTGNVFLRYQLFLCDYEYEFEKKKKQK